MTQPAGNGVLVVPTAEFAKIGLFQGFSPDFERYLPTLLSSRYAHFKSRDLVEDDPTLKQIIPYVIFRSHDDVFCYTRGKGQGERRLHRLKSLGVGGHVDEADADGRANYEAYELALRRELDEEVNIGGEGVLRCVGMINDDSTPVGTVHLGVVYVYDLDSPTVSPREAGLAEAGFVPLAQIRASRDEFETWSQICIDQVLSSAN